MILLFGTAWAAYGDPDFQGHPNQPERELIMWINAARMDPGFWDDQGMYAHAITPCALSDFSSAEQTPKPPLYYSEDLGLTARVHAVDMYDHSFVDTNSSDGTTMETRIAEFYTGSLVGEVNADRHGTPYGPVLKNWMCDPDARGVLMSADATEVGSGRASNYWTADVGAGTPMSDNPITMGNHMWPDGTESTTVWFVADWFGDRVPDVFDVYVGAVATPLDLWWGDGHNGQWGTSVEVGRDLNNCYDYWFYWELEDGSWGTFPEGGSLQVGDRCDGSRGWQEGYLGLVEPEEEEKKGCATGSTGSPKWWMALGALLFLRRRR